MTITLTREEVQQVLDALFDARRYGAGDWISLEETTRARLSAPEPEPVAWYLPSDEGFDSLFRDHRTVVACTGNKWEGWQPLYTAPPQRNWQGLTRSDIFEVYQAWRQSDSHDEIDFVRALEAKLREKNT